MDSIPERISQREQGIDRLNKVTAWVVMTAATAVGVFAVIAAETVPGKASSGQAAGTDTPAAPSSPSSSTATSFRHHHDSAPVSSSSGPPMVVSGGSSH